MAEDTTVIDALGGVTYYQYEGAYVTGAKAPLGRTSLDAAHAASDGGQAESLSHQEGEDQSRKSRAPTLAKGGEILPNQSRWRAPSVQRSPSFPSRIDGYFVDEGAPLFTVNHVNTENPATYRP